MRTRIIAFAIAFVLIACSIAYAWIFATARASMTIKMKSSDSANMTLCTSKTGTFGDSVSPSSAYTIAPCTSTDGTHFYDEGGNASTEYAQFLFYAKGDVYCDNLYVDAVTITPSNSGVKVAVEYDGGVTVLNTTSFTRTCLGRPLDVAASAVKVRVWFDGNTVTEYIDDDITIALDFSAE